MMKIGSKNYVALHSKESNLGCGGEMLKQYKMIFKSILSRYSKNKMKSSNHKKIRIENQNKEKILAKEKLASTAKIRSYIKDALLREENIRKEVKEYE